MGLYLSINRIWLCQVPIAIYCYSALKKKLKDKMAEFQVGHIHTFSYKISVLILFLSFSIIFSQFFIYLKYVDSKRNHPSRVSGGCREASFYRFEPSTCHSCVAITSETWCARFLKTLTNFLFLVRFVIISNGHKSWWRGETYCTVKIPVYLYHCKTSCSN